MARSDLSDVTRAALLDAAIHEFAAHGFDGASTRAIATRAGVHQPQINYHFASKLDLWRAAVALLFEELETEGLERMRTVRGRRAALEAGIRAFVFHAARRPELNRIMVHESGSPSERLDWLVATYVQARFDQLAVLWEPLRRRREVIDVDCVTAFYMVLGGGTLLYTNAPEARLIAGVEPTEPARIEAHAAALIAMLTTRRPTR
ncbi:MAG: helix-turn-helix domain-containing protein [Ilumatobacteraceae bacterium]